MAKLRQIQILSSQSVSSAAGLSDITARPQIKNYEVRPFLSQCITVCKTEDFEQSVGQQQDSVILPPLPPD